MDSVYTCKPCILRLALLLCAMQKWRRESRLRDTATARSLHRQKLQRRGGLNREGRNATTGEGSTITATARKVEGKAYKAQCLSRDFLCPCLTRGHALFSSCRGNPATAPVGRDACTTAAVVAEVLRRLQDRGFLLKPPSTVTDAAAEVAPPADAGRVAGSFVAEDILETLLQGEAQHLQAPEGKKFTSASIPLTNQVL